MFLRILGSRTVNLDEDHPRPDDCLHEDEDRRGHEPVEGGRVPCHEEDSCDNEQGARDLDLCGMEEEIRPTRLLQHSPIPSLEPTEANPQRDRRDKNFGSQSGSRLTGDEQEKGDNEHREQSQKGLRRAIRDRL